MEVLVVGTVHGSGIISNLSWIRLQIAPAKGLDLQLGIAPALLLEIQVSQEGLLLAKADTWAVILERKSLATDTHVLVTSS